MIGVVSYMEKYSSNVDNLKFLDQQAEFMKVFETDKLKAKEDGSAETAIANAKNALKLGLDNETISKITGLSVKEIEKLK